MALNPEAAFPRTDLAQEFDRNMIGNRMFVGNLLRQPAFIQLRSDRPHSFRLAARPKCSD